MELPSILQEARERCGPGPAVFCGAGSWTYESMFREALAVASGFREADLEQGDRVAILHRNCHRFLQAAIGAVFGGQVLVPLNIRLDAPTLAEMLRDSGSRLLLTEGPLEALAREAASRAGGRVSVADVGRVSRPGTRPPEIARNAPEDLAQLYYTSGTTGRPRGVMLLHRNIASHARMAIQELGLGPQDVWAHAAPMFHLADAWAVVAVTLAGGRHVLFPEFEAAEVLQGFERRGVTMTNLVPTMLNRLVADPSAASRRLPRLRLLLSGGAPISTALVRKTMETFRTEYVQTYGLTETSPYLTFSILSQRLRLLPPEEQLRYRAKTGRPAKGVSLRVVGEKGRDVPRDDRSVGEIWVKAPWVFPGYWNRPEETEAAFRDGWFQTGDLATWDEEGFVQIVDRRKDMIITGGEKVFSVEVENALASHPAVFECAVVGTPHPDWGEAVTAAVVLRPKCGAGAGELISFLKERLASFKVPKSVVFLEELPKTGSGKIRKTEIRERLAGR